MHRRGLGTNEAVIFVIIVALIAALFAMLGKTGGQATNQAESASSPSACASSNWMTRAIEDSLGVLSLTCSQPAFSDLSGTDAPSWANILSFPSACSTSNNVGNWVNKIAVTPTCSNGASVLTGTTNIYVDLTSGNDGTCKINMGTKPCLTIQGALNLLPTVINYATNINVYGGTSESEAINFDKFVITASLLIQAQNNSNQTLYTQGTATSGGAATLTDSGASWATNQFQNGVAYIYSGTGAPEIGTISSNTGTVLTMTANWATQPDATSKYVVSSKIIFNAGASATSFTITGKANVKIYGFQFAPSSTALSPVIYQNSAFGGEVKYDSITASSTSHNNFQCLNYCQVAFFYNYLQVAASGQGIPCNSYCKLNFRFNALVSLSAGTGTGLNLQDNSNIGTASAASVFKNFQYGILVKPLSSIGGLSTITFTGNTFGVFYFNLLPTAPVLLANCDPGSSTATQTNCINYTPLANVGGYTIHFGMSVTACTACTLGVTIGYKDEGGNSRSLTMPVDAAGSTALLTSVIATGQYAGQWTFSTDNSATAITLTFTTTGTITYYPVAWLEEGY